MNDSWKNKVYPLMSTTADGQGITNCLGPRCGLWTRMWTTEGLQEEGCAFVMNAMKSEE